MSLGARWPNEASAFYGSRRASERATHTHTLAQIDIRIYGNDERQLTAIALWVAHGRRRAPVSADRFFYHPDM